MALTTTGSMPKALQGERRKPMAKLTTKARKAIPTGSFALPGRRYPIEDANHARNALARVSQHGSPAEKATVRRRVKSKFPGIGGDKKANHNTGGFAHHAPCRGC